MKVIAPLLLISLAACAGSSGSGGYAAPLWTREYCAGLSWRSLGESDAGRFADGERRLAALEESCGMHMRVPRDEYLSGFAAGKAKLGG